MSLWYFQDTPQEYKRLYFAIFINVVNYITPTVLRAFIRFEKLRKSNENLAKMVRIFAIQLVSLALTISFILNDKAKYKCWENEIGQQIYSIAIVDYCFCFVDLFLTALFRQAQLRPEMVNHVKNDWIKLLVGWINGWINGINGWIKIKIKGYAFDERESTFSVLNVLFFSVKVL